MATLKDITDEFYFGEDWIIDFSLKNEAGVALNATGATVELRISKGAVHKKYVNGGANLVMTNLNGGLGTCTIRPADQTDYKKGVWEYELWCQLADTTSSVQAKGTLTISPSLKVSFP